ncbi:MAG: hypothetical protein IKR25_07425 [Muribaculaceae bacterium]|nr:hypothetical protein [Muribaculaceae bacterium]
MKQKLKWMAVAMMIAVAVLMTAALTACGDDEPKGKLTASLLIGTWTAHRENITMTLEFAPNHKGEYKGWGGRSWHDGISWEIISKNEIRIWDDEIAVWVDDGTPYGQIRYDGETFSKTSTDYNSYLLND